MSAQNPLPYKDTKPVGAADFYFAINATFRFIRERLGEDALRSYWGKMGRNYFAPVASRWREGGLSSVVEYWRAFFAAEPEARVEVRNEGDRVVLEVEVCPAIRHLRKGGRVIEPGFCRHCYYVNAAMAAPAGLAARVEGGNGSCRQTFGPPTLAPQKLEDIREAL